MKKIKEFIEKIKEFFHNIYHSIRNIKEEIEFYKEIWEDPKGNAAVKNLFGQLWFLLKKMKPSVVKGRILFGTEDPALTGQLLGAVAVLYGFLPEQLSITPDFENKVFQGTIYVKGKLRLIHVVTAALRLLTDENFRDAAKKVLAREAKEDKVYE